MDELFSCDQAALRMAISVCPSVRLTVCPSVRLWHLFDNVPIIVSSWNFQELLPMTKVMSMQKVKVKGQGHRGHDPIKPFPVRNSSFNSHMVMKWGIKLDVAWERCPIVFEGHPSNFKVTQLKRSLILTQIGRFRTVTFVWIYQWLWNDA